MTTKTGQINLSSPAVLTRRKNTGVILKIYLCLGPLLSIIALRVRGGTCRLNQNKSSTSQLRTTSESQHVQFGIYISLLSHDQTGFLVNDVTQFKSQVAWINSNVIHWTLFWKCVQYMCINLDESNHLTFLPQKTLQPIIDAGSSLEPVLIEVIDPEDKPSDVGQGQSLRVLASPMTKALFFSVPRAMTLVRCGIKVKKRQKKEERQEPDLWWSAEKQNDDRRAEHGAYFVSDHRAGFEGATATRLSCAAWNDGDGQAV